MEPENVQDAEDNLSQALRYHNSLKRSLFYGEDDGSQAMEEGTELAGPEDDDNASFLRLLGETENFGRGVGYASATGPGAAVGHRAAGGMGGRGSGESLGRGSGAARTPQDSTGRGRGKRPAASSQEVARSTRGRGRGKAAYKPPRPAEANVDVDSQPIDEEEVEPEKSLNGNLKEVYDKAEWSFENSRIFCEICIEEIDAGNKPNGVMGVRGYNNIAEKYLKRNGLRHSRLQLKNKWDLLKGLYGFWLQLNRDTGLGWNDALGTVDATEEYWQRVTKGHSDWKKLKKGPPEHEDLLKEMFGDIVVDGSTSCVPGEVLRWTDEEGTFDGHEESPAASVSYSQRSIPLKRGCTSTATSPLKHTKNPMVKVMKNIHATLETNCSIANKVMLGEHLEEKMKEVLDLTVECGAKEGSVEHFMATQLFMKAEHRATFKAFSTMEGRLIWLKRWCMKEGLN